MSDDSSGKGGGVSDSQGEAVTDQEQSDTPLQGGGGAGGGSGPSPPQSGDEKVKVRSQLSNLTLYLCILQVLDFFNRIFLFHFANHFLVPIEAYPKKIKSSSLL